MTEATKAGWYLTSEEYRSIADIIKTSRKRHAFGMFAFVELYVVRPAG